MLKFRINCTSPSIQLRWALHPATLLTYIVVCNSPPPAHTLGCPALYHTQKKNFHCACPNLASPSKATNISPPAYALCHNIVLFLSLVDRAVIQDCKFGDNKLMSEKDQTKGSLRVSTIDVQTINRK